MGKLVSQFKDGRKIRPWGFTILFQTEASFIAKKCDLSFPETKELGSLLVLLCEKGRLCGGKNKTNGEWKNNLDLNTLNYPPAHSKA